MKELFKELVKLTLVALMMLIAFFVFWALVALTTRCFEVLPNYIGHFGTTLLYIAVMMLMFAGIYTFSRKQ